MSAPRGQSRFAVRAANGRTAAHEGRDAARRRVLERRHGVRDRRPLPASRVPAASGNGRGRARHVSLASRALRPRVGLHARPLGRRRARVRRRRPRRRRVRDAAGRTPIRSATCRRGCATGSKTTSRSSSRSRCSVCSTRACRRRRSCAPAWSSARATAARVGARASPCWSRWPTCSPSSHPTTRRSRSCTDSRSSRATRAITRRGSRSARSRRKPFRSTASASWYRRFVDTRSSDAAERTLETALAEPGRLADVETMMFAAVTDHVFIDGGHTIDFTNKAFEAVEHLGKDAAGEILPTLVRQTTAASRSEEFGEWRHPAQPRGARAAHDRGARRRARRGPGAPGRVRRRGRARLAAPRRRSRSRRGRAARRAARRRRRGAARPGDRLRGRAPHRALPRAERPRRLGHGAPRVHRGERAAPGAATPPDDRAPARRGARRAAHQPRPLPQRAGGAPARTRRAAASTRSRTASTCRAWSTKRATRRTGSCGRAAPAPSSSPRSVTRLLAEDAEFHWYQVLEAGVRQSQQWPEGSEEAALVLTAVARFLAAHTPTRRELPTVVRIATRLRRGEALYEDEATAQTRAGA